MVVACGSVVGALLGAVGSQRACWLAIRHGRWPVVVWMIGGAARGRPVAAEAGRAAGWADAVADRFSARDAVGARGPLLESPHLIGHRGGELLAPPGPRQRFVVEQQHRPGGVRLEATGLDVGLEVQHNPFVAEADAEVLKASIAASGLRQDVVELIVEHRGGVTGGGPQKGFATPGAMIVVEHPPVRDRVAQLHRARRDGVPLEVVALAVDAPQLPRLAAGMILAHQHLDPRREPHEAAVEVAGDPFPPGLRDALRRLRGVVPLMLAEQYDLGAMILAAQKPRLLSFTQRSPEVGCGRLPSAAARAPSARPGGA